MKWYKKQLDKLKKSKSPKPGGAAVAEKTSGHSFGAKKIGAKKTFPDPVAISKLGRPKTDIH